MPAGSGGGRAIGVSGAPGKVPVHGQATGAATPADAELPAAWVGTWPPEELEVVALPPAVPDAALPTQPHGSEEVVAAPAAEVVAALALAEGAEEALVAGAAAGGGVGLAGGVFTNVARSLVPAAMMMWALAMGSGGVGLLAAAPDPTIAALAATVASAAATGSVACQATEAPAMRVWERGLEAAIATAWDVSERGAWNRAGSDDCEATGSAVEDATGSAVEGMSWPGATNRELLE